MRFSREETSQKKAIDLAASAMRSVKLVRHYAVGSQVDIVCELGGKPVLTLGSSIELEQVIVNLLRNAIEASSPGGRTTVALSQIEGLVRLSVSDEGSGMTEEAREHAFDPFYTTRRDVGGTGLGLSIAHGIATQHNGTLQIVSQPGKGTIVTMELAAFTQP